MVVRNESLSHDQMSSNKVLGGCKTIPKIESIEELNFFNPENIQFSIDLVTEAQKSTDFLHKIEKDYPMLYEDAYAINAIKRYEQYWLPLQAKFHQTSIFTPPLDVHWAWHCHMLAPVQYRIDCEKLIGFVPDHEYASNPNSTDIWNQYCTYREPYDFLVSNPNRDTKFVSKFGYDILAAMQRQRSFNYQVCLPHYTDGKFLNAAVDRYRKFLHLARVCLGVTLMPSYDIDLIWHCHQAHPVAYYEDTRRILGHILNHDDSIGDETFKSKSDDVNDICYTKKYWRYYFSDRFLIPGSMYRGHEAPGSMGFLFREEEKRDKFRAHLELELGRFRETYADEDLLKIFEAFSRRSSGFSSAMKCCIAEHSVLNSDKEILYTVKVVYPCYAPFLPLILIHDQSTRLLSMACPISSNELPTEDQLMSNRLNEIPHLSAIQQCAMIVMGKDGDSHIIKCSKDSGIHVQIVIFNLKSNALQKFHIPRGSGSLSFHLEANNEGMPSKKLWDYEKLASACTGKCTGACQNTDSELISECSGKCSESCSSQCDLNNISMFASACSGKCSGACATSQ